METVMEGHGEIYKQLKKMQRAIRHRSVGSVIDFNLAELNASFIPDFHEVGVSCRIAILPHPGQCFKTRVSLYHYLSGLALRSTPADSAEPVFTNKLIPFVNKAFAISQELKEKKKKGVEIRCYITSNLQRRNRTTLGFDDQKRRLC